MWHNQTIHQRECPVCVIWIFNMTYLKSKVLVGSEIQEEVILETTSLVMESNLLSKGQWRCNQNEREVERKTFNINKWVNWTRHEALSCWCFQELSYLILSFHSPSTANSDKYLIPPDNVTPQSHSKGNDHQLKKLLIVKLFSPCQHHRNCIKNSKGNMHTVVRV